MVEFSVCFYVDNFILVHTDAKKDVWHRFEHTHAFNVE